MTTLLTDATISELQAELARRSWTSVLEDFSAACAKTAASPDIVHWYTIWEGMVHNLRQLHRATADLGIDQIKKYAAYKKLPKDPSHPILPRGNLSVPALVSRDRIVQPHTIATGGPSHSPVAAATMLNIAHWLLGIVSDTDELVEAFLIGTSSGYLDAVNIQEEIGDVLFYLDRLAHECGSSLEQCMLGNMQKLEKRYGGVFSETAANTRDLGGERKVLKAAFTAYQKVPISEEAYSALLAGVESSMLDSTPVKQLEAYCTYCCCEGHDQWNCQKAIDDMKTLSNTSPVNSPDDYCTYCSNSGHTHRTCPDKPPAILETLILTPEESNATFENLDTKPTGN